MKYLLSLTFITLLLFPSFSFGFDQEDLDRLKKTNECVECDLSDANLGGADLSGAYLWDAKLRGANLNGANLRGAKLNGADLQGATLYGANLFVANLNDADLKGANFNDADLSGANLEGANLNFAKLIGSASFNLYEDYFINKTISCEEYSIQEHVRYIQSKFPSYLTQDLILNSKVSMFVKVARFKNDIIPTNIENGDLLNYSSFEEIQREGQETDVRLSMTLLRNAIISCSWKAKRLNDIQDGLEEETISGKVDDLSDIWKILYTLDKGRVEISSYTYFCKN